MPVSELLERVSPRELLEWEAYERVAGPLGPHRGDIQAAVVASTVANVNRGKGRPLPIQDFIPEWDRRPQTWQEQLKTVEQLNALFGGADTRPRSPRSAA